MVRLVPTFDDMKFESAIDDAYKKGYADGSLAVTEEILAHKDKEIRAKVYEEVIERIDLGVCQFCCGGCDEGCDTFELSALQKWLQIKLDELKKG